MKRISYLFFLLLLVLTSCGSGNKEASTSTVYNVKDYGAKGDGVTDDTQAIQALMDAVVDKGGGTIYFPNGRYRLATIQERLGVKAHLIIKHPTQVPGKRHHLIMIKLEGENCVVTPCAYASHASIDTLQVWDNGAILFSDVLGEKITDATTTPTFVLAAGANAKSIYLLNPSVIRLENLAFQVKTEPGKYPYLSGINMVYAATVYTDNVLVYASERNMILKSPSLDGHYSAGFVGPRLNCNPEQNFNNTYVKSAFRYGFILSEHANGNNLSAWNCDDAFVFSYMHHSAWLGRIHAQNCKNIISALETEFCGHKSGHSFIEIEQVGIEVNTDQEPKEFNYAHFVVDPSDFLIGKMRYHIVKSNVGADNSYFNKVGGANLKAEPSF